jgi:hypothetical protein
LFFLIAGGDDTFSGGAPGDFVGPDGEWMQRNLVHIGGQTLRTLCIPGSHDTGMSVLNGGTAFATKDNCITQKRDIGGQLALGNRFFDIRPCVSAGKFVAGHYSDTGNDVLKWQGGNGQSLADVISQVNAYTAQHAELIIIDISHCYNTDTDPYRDFNADEYKRCFQQLQGLTHLYASSASDITQVTLQELIGSGQAAVVVIVEDNVDMTGFTGNGFFLKSGDNNNFVNEYSDSDDENTMATDQIAKLIRYRPTPQALPFLLSWTLTQTAIEAVLGPSILTLADRANSILFSKMVYHVSRLVYPNVVYIDGIDDTDSLELSLCISLLAASV